MKVALIIPAAGSSSRYGAGRSKLDEDLGGRPVLQRTLEAFANHPEVGPMIAATVVAGPHASDAFAEFKTRHADRLGLLGASVCRGGKQHRYETVAAALEHLATLPAGNDCTHVAVHDAARPCVPAELLTRIFDAAAKHPAVIPALPVSDTLKRVREEEGGTEAEDPIADILGLGGAKAPRRVVAQTLDRAGVMAVQTPQVFRAELLRRAYTQADLTSTDDAQLVERLGEPVIVIEGDERNLKITRPTDMRLARAILGVRDPEDRATHKRF